MRLTIGTLNSEEQINCHHPPNARSRTLAHEIEIVLAGVLTPEGTIPMARLHVPFDEAMKLAIMMIKAVETGKQVEHSIQGNEGGESADNGGLSLSDVMALWASKTG